MPAGPVWRMRPGSTLRWRRWDDEFVVYHEESGDTHRLNALGARVIERLTDRSFTVEELVARLSPELGDQYGPDFAGTVGVLLAHLRSLGVAERVNTE